MSSNYLRKCYKSLYKVLQQNCNSVMNQHHDPIQTSTHICEGYHLHQINCVFLINRTHICYELPSLVQPGNRHNCMYGVNDNTYYIIIQTPLHSSKVYVLAWFLQCKIYYQLFFNENHSNNYLGVHMNNLYPSLTHT